MDGKKIVKNKFLTYFNGSACGAFFFFFFFKKRVFGVFEFLGKKSVKKKKLEF